MKINLVRITFLLLTTLIFSIGCKKTIFDYRHKYIGEWDIVLIKDFWWATGETVDTSNYQGEILYGPSDDEIKINNVPYFCYQFTVDKDGQLSCPNQHNPIGTIDKKSINFIVISMSPGSHTTLTVNGQKK